MTEHAMPRDMRSLTEEPTTRVRVSDRDELKVWVMGEGYPVLFSHGAFWPDLLVPLMAELGRKGDYQLIHYHRRGYGGKPTGPVDFPLQARDIVKILDALAIDKAHVFGHSYAGAIVLELVGRAPERVHSAVVAGLVTGEAEERAMETLAVADAKYESGDKKGAATILMTPFDASQELINQISPGDIDIFFLMDNLANTGPMIEPDELQESETPIAVMDSFGSAAEGVPATKVMEIAHSDHFFVVKKPVETAAALHEWLDSQNTTAHQA